MTDTLRDLAADPATPDGIIDARCDEILTHSVRHPLEEVLLARHIRSARKHTQGESLKSPSGQCPVK